MLQSAKNMRQKPWDTLAVGGGQFGTYVRSVFSAEVSGQFGLTKIVWKCLGSEVSSFPSCSTPSA